LPSRFCIASYNVLTELRRFNPAPSLKRKENDEHFEIRKGISGSE
jgi:hypothetical protein